VKRIFRARSRWADGEKLKIDHAQSSLYARKCRDAAHRPSGRHNAWTHSHDINLDKQNALKLARIAKALGLPTVLTSSMKDKVQGPLVAEPEQILLDEFMAHIKRPGIVNAMHHEGFNKAVKGTGGGGDYPGLEGN
jgi:hypothetical protein